MSQLVEADAMQWKKKNKKNLKIQGENHFFNESQSAEH